MAGLRDEECWIPDDVVRRAHALQLLIFTGLSALPFDLLDAEPTPELHRVAEHRAAIARFSLDLVERTAYRSGRSECPRSVGARMTVIAVTGTTGKLGIAGVAPARGTWGRAGPRRTRPDEPCRSCPAPRGVVRRRTTTPTAMRSALDGTDTVLVVSASLSGRRLEEHASAVPGRPGGRCDADRLRVVVGADPGCDVRERPRPRGHRTTPRDAGRARGPVLRSRLLRLDAARPARATTARSGHRPRTAGWLPCRTTTSPRSPSRSSSTSPGGTTAEVLGR